MADQKISQLTDGTSFQAGDEAVVNRSGTNFKVDPTQFGSSIDVTGTVTADGLTFAAGSKIASDGGLVLNIDSDSSSGSTYFEINADSTSRPVARFVENGDISFYEDTGTTPKFFWDASAEALGIGTSSPSANLDIVGDATSAVLEVKNTAGQGLNLTGGTSGVDIRTPNSLPITFATANTEAMRIDSGGNLLVGTTTAGSMSGDTLIKFGAGGIISKNVDDVANNGTVDITVASTGGFQGFLAVANTVGANANVRTHTTYSVFGRGTDASIQQIATDNGSTGGASFTVTVPSNGTIRVTNTSGNTTDISIQFFGGQST